MPSCCLYYAGYKTSTADVIAFVEKRRKTAVAEFSDLDDRMDACSKRVFDSICRQDISQLGDALEHGQRIMEAYGVCDETLTEMMLALSKNTNAFCKISGSGLGDCVLAIPDIPDDWGFPYRRISVAIEGAGVREESNV
jgi:mevalonate kinase